MRRVWRRDRPRKSESLHCNILVHLVTVICRDGSGKKKGAGKKGGNKKKKKAKNAGGAEADAADAVAERDLDLEERDFEDIEERQAKKK